MKKLIVSIIAIAAISSAMIQPSHSQDRASCFKYDQLVAGLDKDFTEVAKIRGLTTNGQKMLEILVNKKTGTWTAIMVQRNGAACPVASGKAFSILDDVKPAADGPVL